MTLLAAQTALWLGLGLAAGFLFVLAALPLLAVALAVFDGDADEVADVQRFIELTEQARSLVPPGLPLVDGKKAAATTAALVHFQEKKDEARRALWASRDRPPAIASTGPGRGVVGAEGGSRQPKQSGGERETGSPGSGAFAEPSAGLEPSPPLHKSEEGSNHPGFFRLGD